MQIKLTKALTKLLKEKEQEFINKDYKKILSTKPNSSLTEEDVVGALSDYEGDITPAPDNYYKALYAIEISGTKPPEYFVDFDLWIDNKQSDLTASFQIIQTPDGTDQAVLNNLHTL